MCICREAICHLFERATLMKICVPIFYQSFILQHHFSLISQGMNQLKLFWFIVTPELAVVLLALTAGALIQMLLLMIFVTTNVLSEAIVHFPDAMPNCLQVTFIQHWLILTATLFFTSEWVTKLHCLVLTTAAQIYNYMPQDYYNKIHECVSDIFA